ncbi:hypothetical protein BB559_006110 [Furculomyces boomerangus]|uniref:Uncharacterized protein n=1 Tax=Furculomyces boomerangus TaxID=61424 RepID=A0A2T9Y4R5_9FUNG|nr:hypothetical protein BB559_006110 [Furculomyces boomerangus]
MNNKSTIQQLSKVKHIVLVLSGKGGVGKSSVTVQLAISLLGLGKKVGILDVDLCGPSIPRMLGLENQKIHQATNGWVPVFVDSEKKLGVMSIGFLLPDKNTSVVWRGPKKSTMIKQFLTDVYWGELDYLLIDTPPGTSDEHLSIVEYLQKWKPDGAVLVTTPQNISVMDVRKELNFCQKVSLPVIGIIENMSGYVCEHCSECTNIFSSGGGLQMAKEFGLNFLGAIPIDTKLVEMLDNTQTSENRENKHLQLIQNYKSSNLSPLFSQIAQSVISCCKDD